MFMSTTTVKKTFKVSVHFAISSHSVKFGRYNFIIIMSCKNQKTKKGRHLAIETQIMLCNTFNMCAVCFRNMDINNNNNNNNNNKRYDFYIGIDLEALSALQIITVF